MFEKEIIGAFCVGFVTCIVFCAFMCREKKGKENDSDEVYRVSKLAAWVETLHEKTNRVEKVQNLILSHLNLEYVPETTKNEPAKLVEKKPCFELPDDYYNILAQGAAMSYIKGKGKSVSKAPKKKRGRPKKK